MKNTIPLEGATSRGIFIAICWEIACVVTGLFGKVEASVGGAKDIGGQEWGTTKKGLFTRNSPFA